MPISEQTIQELVKVVWEDYGEKITPEQASDILRNLVGYFDLLAKINYQEATDNTNDENK